MIAGIKAFFSQYIEAGATVREAFDERGLRVATAALMIEMMRMDDHVSEAERAAMNAALASQFNLTQDQMQQLVALADLEARAASGYHQFTTLINQRCDLSQKIRIVENLWLLAMADGTLGAHELHLMRKLGDLLHVDHADFVAAKQRAREASGLAPG